jgi:hypothetical protein
VNPEASAFLTGVVFGALLVAVLVMNTVHRLRQHRDNLLTIIESSKGEA